MAEFLNRTETFYDTYNFGEYHRALMVLITGFLSPIYIDTSRDRLYNMAVDSFSRRACQTTLYHVFMVLLKTLAPITPHMAEEAWRCLPNAWKDGKISIFESGWPKAHQEWTEEFGPGDLHDWNLLLQVKAEVNTVMDKARKAKLIGPS